MIRHVLTAVLIAVVLMWPTSGSAQVDAWSCDSAPVASPTSSPKPAARVDVPFPAEGGSVTIFAAASLTDAFSQMAEDIQQANPNVDITFNFAGSQTLVTQVVEGASADVLALANLEQMTKAVEEGVPATDSIDFVGNLMVVVVPNDNPVGISDPSDLAQDGVRLVLANEDVPAGRYARQSLCRIAEASGTSDVSGYAANVVSEEENVRAVLTKVELGEADAGIVYRTDAMTAGDAVTEIGIPLDQNVVARYPIAAISDNPLAAAFVSYVLSDAGQATLLSFGFESVG